MSIKLVLFDAAGVLFPANKIVGEDLARRFGMSEDRLTAMWQGIYQAYTVGKLSTEEFLDAFAAMYQLDRDSVSESNFTDSFLGALVPMPGIEDLLEELKANNVRMALLSDTTPMFAKARTTLNFSRYFDHEFLSFDLGHKKPDAQTYQAVLTYYDLHPAEVIFVDDMPGNVEGATACGLQAVLFTDTANFRSALVQARVIS